MSEIQSGVEAPILNVMGDLVALGPLRRDLLPLYQRWVNSFPVMHPLGMVYRPQTLDAEEAWYNSMAKAPDAALFTIYERSTMRPIGSTSLRDIDHSQGTANFGIFIGEQDCWGRGYGTEATSLVLDYGFTALSLHNIMLRVFSYNQRALRAYSRAGFRVIGRRREAHRLGGQTYDVILMDCLATECQSPAFHRMLNVDKP